MHSKDLAAKCHIFVYARIQKNRVLTWSYGHFVGAYGVYGFSGVKDARRASSSPTLQRRLQIQCKPSAPSVQSGCSSVAIPVQDLEQSQCEMSAVRERNAERSENFHREA